MSNVQEFHIRMNDEASRVYAQFQKNVGVGTTLTIADLKKLQKTIKDVESGTGGMAKGNGMATQSLISMTQAVQDAPYGIRGMANNIQFLTQNLGALYTQSGGMKGMLVQLKAGLTGPIGILVAVSAVTAAWDWYSNRVRSVGINTEALSEGVKKVSENFVGLSLDNQRSVLDTLIKTNVALNEKIEVMKTTNTLTQVMTGQGRQLVQITSMQQVADGERLVRLKEIQKTLSAEIETQRALYDLEVIRKELFPVGGVGKLKEEIQLLETARENAPEQNVLSLTNQIVAKQKELKDLLMSSSDIQDERNKATEKAKKVQDDLNASLARTQKFYDDLFMSGDPMAQLAWLKKQEPDAGTHFGRATESSWGAMGAEITKQKNDADKWFGVKMFRDDSIKEMSESMKEFGITARNVAGMATSALSRVGDTIAGNLFSKTREWADVWKSTVQDMVAFGIQEFAKFGLLQLLPSLATGGVSSIFTGLFHDGGEVQRAHSGAVAGYGRLKYDEVPAILQTGERVLSRAENRNYGKGSNMSFTLNVNGREEDIDGYLRSNKGMRTVVAAVHKAIARGKE